MQAKRTLRRNRHMTSIETVRRSEMDMLFRPRSVALTGLSADMNKLTGAPLRHILKVGVPGRIYTATPQYHAHGGLHCLYLLEDFAEAHVVHPLSLATANE